jgi:hypothetical protein
MEITYSIMRFTLESLNLENQQFLSNSRSYVVLFIHQIKSYMTNLNPHQRPIHHLTPLLNYKNKSTTIWLPLLT